MGSCAYCGKSAGFMRNRHQGCVDRHESAVASIRGMCVSAALRGGDLDELPNRIKEAGASGFVSMGQGPRWMKDILTQGWRHALVAAMEDRVLSSEERRGLNRYRRRFGLDESALNAEGHFELFKQLTLLTSLQEDGVVPRFDHKGARARHGRLPFNMMKSEEPLWLFDGVGYVQQVTSREFQGGSLGASFRVTKGVYVRPSAFRGKSVESKSMEQTDSGMLALTTKHLYFRGSEKAFRVRLDRIVSFEPYEDGLGIMRDTARAKPEVFMLGGNDAWFVVNLFDSLMDMDDLNTPKRDAPTLDELVDDGPQDGGDAAGLFFAAGSL